MDIWIDTPIIIVQKKQDTAHEHEPECSHVENFCETSLKSLVHFPSYRTSAL